MMISRCPRCDEAYLIPAGSFPENSYAQCPWCRETFPLEEALKRLPPVLEIMDAGGNAIQPAVATRTGAAAASSFGGASFSAAPGQRDDFGGGNTFDDSTSEDLLATIDASSPYREESTDFAVEEPLRLETSSESDVEPEFLLPEQDENQRPAPMRVQGTPSLQSKPRRKKKSSPIRTLIGFALGPVIALPLVGGILLAMGRAPDLGFYPFDGSFDGNSARNLSASAPVNLPAPGPRPSTPSAGGRSLADDLEPSVPTTPDPAQSALAEIQSDLDVGRTSGLTTSDPDPLSDLVPTTTEAASELAMPALPVPDLVPESIPVPDQPGVVEVPVDEPLGDSSLAMPAEEPTSAPDQSVAAEELMLPEIGGVDPVAEVAASLSPELANAQQRVSGQLDELIGFTGEKKQRDGMLAATYSSLAEVASLMETADAAALSGLIAKVKQEPQLLNDLSAAAPQWLKFSRRPNNGIVVVGQLVEDASPTKLRLNDGTEVALAGSVPGLGQTGQILGLGEITDGPEGQAIELKVAESLK